VRLNIGCGTHHIQGFVQIDADINAHPDIVARVPPLPFPADDIEEVYAGHFLEHLDQDDGRVFVAECYRVLKPGGLCTLVVPDIEAVMRRWLGRSHDAVEVPLGVWRNVDDLDDVATVFLYGTPNSNSHHLWAYCASTLARLMANAGFRELHAIDRERDWRLTSPAWFQCGVEGRKP
jgi:predicted SAM-dependent methyltransferase